MDEKRIDGVRRRIEARLTAADPAHDFLHVLRVERTARDIAEREGADVVVVVLAALCHELFNHPKNHPESARSGEVCAEHARALLEEQAWDPDTIDRVCEAIRVHSFSAGLPAETLEAKVLQDADRLDAVGAIGIARCFATSATMQRPFYATTDPFCRARPPDDKQFALDHFYKKLAKIPERLHTARARELALPRVKFLHEFVAQLRAEIAPSTIEPLPIAPRTAGVPVPVTPKKA